MDPASIPHDLQKKKGNFNKAMKYIIKKLKNKKNRSATFICSLSFKAPNGKLFTVEGRVKGTITFKIIGNKGFGYDSIFKPNFSKLTFGEMPKNVKLKKDHRFIAFKKLKKKVKIL